MQLMHGTFEGRFLSKLNKIDKQEIESFLSHLVREKHFLEIVFNALDDGLVVLRPNLSVIYANNAAIDLLGINPKRRIVGERLAALVPIQDFGELVARFALQRERVVGAEFDSRDSPPRALSVTVIPLEKDIDSQVGSVIVLVRDATDARRMATERQRLERASTLHALAAGLAHEIKNPLNSLQIHAQLLQRALRDADCGGGKRSAKARPARDAAPVDQQRLVQSSDVIVEEIRRLTGVVNEFLSATRPTRPMFQQANANRLLEKVAATLQPEAEQRRVELRLALDHDLPPVKLDPDQMTQVILNLLKNALEAVAPTDTERDSRGAAEREHLHDALTISPRPAPAVELRTEHANGLYRIRVADNGPGVSPDDLKRIFDPYYTTKPTGTGLGLAIVSRIIEDHGGELSINSAPGVGTAVTLTLRLDARPVRLLE